MTSLRRSQSTPRPRAPSEEASDRDKWISAVQLRRNNGERGMRKWIAHEGIVYDVTDCAKWRGALHEGLHFPGQDLTSEVVDAPHGAEVFSRECVKRIGRLLPEPPHSL